MARPVTALLVFFLGFQLFAVMLGATGVAGVLGLDTSVGEPCPTDNPTDAQIASNPNCKLTAETAGIPSGPGTGPTLLGFYNTLGGFLSGIYTFLFPGLRMLNRAGVPIFITDRFLGDIFSLLIAIDVAAYMRGYQL